MNRLSPLLKRSFFRMLAWLPLLGLLFLWGSRGSAASCQYWIAPSPTGNDANTGSASAPWATLEHASETVPDNGCTIWVEPGVYNGNERISRRFTVNTTFQATQAYKAVFQNNGPVLNISGATHLTFSGFRFRHSGPGASPLVVYIDWNDDGFAEHITLRNNIFHDSYNNDILKIHDGVRFITVARNIFYNQGSGEEHIDLNSATDAVIEENIFFNDFAGSGRTNPNDTKDFIVIKDSNGANDGQLGAERVWVRRNVFLNWEGYLGEAFVQVGKDGKTYFEARDVFIENNLLIGNSGDQTGSAFGVSGAKDVTFANNTIVGDLPSRSFAMRVVIRDQNPLNENIFFYNNIWSDPTGTMGADLSGSSNEFSDGEPENTVNEVLDNNLYWNGGAAIPDGDFLSPMLNDPRALVGNPGLNTNQNGVVLPRWNGNAFLSGANSVLEEFNRLVNQFGTIPTNSPAVDQADPSRAPAVDILGRPRGSNPDLGAFEAGAGGNPTPTPTPTNTALPTFTHTPLPTGTSPPLPTATSTAPPTDPPQPSPTNTAAPPTGTSPPNPNLTTLEVRISNRGDDAEEAPDGAVDLRSTDLEMVMNGGLQTVGMRFNNITIPPNATIANAYIQFTADEADSGPLTLLLQGQLDPNPPTFSTTAWNISGRPRTQAFQAWSPPDWNTIGASGPDQQTPNLANIVQEIVGQPGWASGNSIVFIVTGTDNVRTAESSNGSGPDAPLLHIEFSSGAPPPATATPPPAATGTTAPPPTATPLPPATNTPQPTPTPTSNPTGLTFEVRVDGQADDAEERSNGMVNNRSRDLKMGQAGGSMLVGLRFNNVTIPPGATITRAYVEFTVDEVSVGPIALQIQGDRSPNPAAFTARRNDLSNRQPTFAGQAWSPPDWTTVGAAGQETRTADISHIIQEIIGQNGWTSGNSLVLILSGSTNKRIAEAWDGSAADAPLLHIEYTLGGAFYPGPNLIAWLVEDVFDALLN